MTPDEFINDFIRRDMKDNVSTEKIIVENLIMQSLIENDYLEWS